MAHLIKNFKVPPNSTSLEEARRRTFDFFRMCCRSIPQIMEIYNLQDVVTPSHLRSSVASEFRRNSKITNPKVIDMLLFKGLEELKNVVEHSKQRHHLIGQYVTGGRQGLGAQNVADHHDDTSSDFLKNFYRTNYF
ncbi:unnamed protein product [Cuscuta campestris]|uniref:NADH dehydrogenase [ubiquinone] 1 alpha subcomplex subunit 6 n=2 Tax=Cuscuta sect. Cleistogrammica TaxID=1824901 RepID=A0A484NPM9_9ASTE|nr:hypothetical protein DM860_009847 [Cuscuta australis]VFQ60048.1 unnamed protein product [Cuscuta campestris]VFR02883.1 unnamed protein product [Cuscuta campestris]